MKPISSFATVSKANKVTVTVDKKSDPAKPARSLPLGAARGNGSAKPGPIFPGLKAGVETHQFEEVTTESS
jgi:hypothetical protein